MSEVTERASYAMIQKKVIHVAHEEVTAEAPKIEGISNRRIEVMFGVGTTADCEDRRKWRAHRNPHNLAKPDAKGFEEA